MNLSPFPELRTERLRLRQIVKTDWREILFLRSDETVTKYIKRPENRRTKNEVDALIFIEMIHKAVEDNISVSWGITFLDNPVILGTICLWNFSEDAKTAEVGYDLNPKCQGKGIMSEAIRHVLSFGFGELKLDIIEAFTDNENVSSRLLLERNGFELIKGRKDEGNSSNLIFELRRESF